MVAAQEGRKDKSRMEFVSKANSVGARAQCSPRPHAPGPHEAGKEEEESRKPDWGILRDKQVKVGKRHRLRKLAKN